MKGAFDFREKMVDAVEDNLARLEREMEDGSMITLRTERYHSAGSERDGFQASARALTGADGSEVLPEADVVDAAALERASRAIHVFDENGIIRYTNKAFDGIFGHPRDSLRGKHLSALNFYSIEDNARLMAGIIVEAHVRGCWRGFLSYRRFDEVPFAVATYIQPYELSGRRYWIAVQEPPRPAAVESMRPGKGEAAALYAAAGREAVHARRARVA